MKGQVVNLVSQGLNVFTIAKRLGVTHATIGMWIKKDERFGRAIQKAKENYAKEKIESSLWSLATGHAEETVTEEYMGTKVVNGEERPCKYTKKTTVKAPSEKALMALASKYAPEEYKETDRKELTIRITQRDRSLTTEERLKLLESEGSEVVTISDYKDLTTSIEGTESEGDDALD